MIPVLAVLLHGDDGRMDLIYFWGAILIAALPVIVFIVIGVLVTRGYFRRKQADGGGEPPVAAKPAVRPS